MNIAALESVIHIEQQAYSHPWSRGNFTDALAAGYQTQLLYQNHELLGYFVAMMGVEEAHLLNLTVAPVHQGRGWARLLLDTLGQWARTQGAQWLWLEVRQSNLRAQQVYAAHGFRQVGERKRYYPAHNGQREDAVVMSLML
jgi:ribosomal-protein-alanine N-acetyltransferase